jgi:hypothetical protein
MKNIGRLYVANEEGERVMELDLNVGKVKKRIEKETEL